jgi:hypothetical protein
VVRGGGRAWGTAAHAQEGCRASHHCPVVSAAPLSLTRQNSRWPGPRGDVSLLRDTTCAVGIGWCGGGAGMWWPAAGRRRRRGRAARTWVKASQAACRGERTARTRRRSCPAALVGGRARQSLSMPWVRSYWQTRPPLRARGGGGGIEGRLQGRLPGLLSHHPRARPGAERFPPRLPLT